MDPVFCFIDDAGFELENFRQNAAPAFAGVEMVYAQSFEQAQAELAGRPPLCFLLDIYGGDPQAGAPRVLPLPELEQALGRGLELEALYAGLEQGGAEAGNLFLRRLYGQVERWQRAFLLAAGELGQGRSYGLYNLAQVREHYPWAAALGYSRKALYADAVAMCLAGADGVLQKPQGADDAAIALATAQAAPGLLAACRQAARLRLAAWLAGEQGRAGQTGPRDELRAWLEERQDGLTP